MKGILFDRWKFFSCWESHVVWWGKASCLVKGNFAVVEKTMFGGRGQEINIEIGKLSML